MKKPGTGEFLFHYYKKQEASLRVHLYKISRTGSPADVHRTRVGLKKIRALFALFEMADPQGFSRKEGWKIFDDLFRHAGRMRELHVNRAFVDKYGGDDSEFLLLKKYISDIEKRILRNFISSLERFSGKEIKAVSRKVRTTGARVSPEQIITKSLQLIRKKAVIIRRLDVDTAEPETIHKVRKHLKAMSAIAALTCTLHNDERMESILAGLKKAEELIGEWHDRTVLVDFVDQYLEKPGKKKTVNTGELLKFSKAIIKEADILLKQIIPEVHSVLETIGTIKADGPKN